LVILTHSFLFFKKKKKDWLYLGLSKSSPLIPSINMIKRTVADFDDLLTMDDDDMIVRTREINKTN